MTWRVGNSLGLTVYDESLPCTCTTMTQKCNCRYVGTMHTVELADRVVDAMNLYESLKETGGIRVKFHDEGFEWGAK